MMALQMLEEMNLHPEYTVVARSWLDDDNGAIVRSDAIFEDMAEAEHMASIIRQFKLPSKKPTYTDVKIAVRYCTDWSTEEEKPDADQGQGPDPV